MEEYKRGFSGFGSVGKGFGLNGGQDRKIKDPLKESEGKKMAAGGIQSVFKSLEEAGIRGKDSMKVMDKAGRNMRCLLPASGGGRVPAPSYRTDEMLTVEQKIAVRDALMKITMDDVEAAFSFLEETGVRESGKCG